MDFSFYMPKYSHIPHPNNTGTIKGSITTEASVPNPNFVNVGEFIEKCRQEKGIGGILESSVVLYRLFQLLGHGLKQDLHIRWSYESSYIHKLLNIDCLTFQ